MKPYGRNGHIRFHGKQDNTHNRHYISWWEYERNTIAERGSISNRLRKIIDEAVEDHYQGYEDWLEKIDPFLCDCTLRPDLEFYQNKQNEK